MDKLKALGTNNGRTIDEQKPIKTGSFAGLNTVTPLLNLPYEDSPNLVNTNSGLSGSMSKRLGTRVSYSLDGAMGGFSSQRVRTALKHSYVVTKQGTDMKIYETVGQTTSLLMTKPNVWSSVAAGERAITTVTNETQTRVIFVTGKDAPVQLSLCENSVTTAGVGTSFTVQDPLSLYKWATTGNLIIYRNGTKISDAFSVAWASNVLTITGLNSTPAGTEYHVVLFTWQWVAEAFRYGGYDLYYPTTKFHIDATDQNISIPLAVRDNIFTLTSTRVYPFYVYKSTNWNDTYTLKTDFNPTTFSEYHFGSGAIFTPGTPMRVAPNYVTFGAIRPALAAPEEVNIVRGRLLPFNGGAGVAGSNIKVLLNNTVLTQSTNVVTPVAGSYYLRDNAGNVLTSTASVAHHITFDSATNVGLYLTDEVIVVNVSLSDIGSGATTNLDFFRDGAAQPMFGIGLVSYYGLRFHPTSVSTYQGRLVFSGWRHDALHVLASEVWDATVRGLNFVNYDIPRNAGLTTDPVDVQLTAYADDYVVNTLELNGSLFVFTRNAVFGIKPTQGALTATGVQINKVANIGLVNPRAVDVIENTILFLSDGGVYDITATNEADDYTTGERSIKIRNLIAQQLSEANKDTAFLAYNKNTSEVYLGIPSKTDTITASRLFIYSLLRDSWYRYSTPSGWNIWGATPIVDSTKGTGFLLWVTTKYSGNSPNNLIALLTDNKDYYLDFVTTATGTGSPQTIVLPPTPTTTLTTVLSQREYKPSFEITPFPEVQDLTVTLNGVTQVYKTDWVKRTNGTIYFLSDPGSGKTVVMTLRRPINDDEVGNLNWGTANYGTHTVFVNNVAKKQGTDYTVAADGTITLTAVPGASIVVGVSYLSLYATPMFTQDTLSRFKRLIHFYGYLNNAEGLENFTGVDVVGAQNPDEVVDRPKKKLGVSVAMAYDSGYSSELTFDLYGFSSLVWDFSQFDTAAPVQDKPYILFKEPMQGLGYGFQVYFYNWDEKFFDIVGYQVDGKMKGRFNVR